MERILAAIPAAVDEIRGKEARRQGGKDGRAASDVGGSRGYEGYASGGDRKDSRSLAVLRFGRPTLLGSALSPEKKMRMKCCKIVTGGEGGFLYRVEKIKWLKREGLGRILLFGVASRISGGRGRNRVAIEDVAGLERLFMPRRCYHERDLYSIRNNCTVEKFPEMVPRQSPVEARRAPRIWQRIGLKVWQLAQKPGIWITSRCAATRSVRDHSPT
jgi:hypothetical protein